MKCREDSDGRFEIGGAEIGGFCFPFGVGDAKGSGDWEVEVGS